MLLISDLASMELMSGFHVPGVWVIATTSSSLARTGAARAERARTRRTTRRIMVAKVASRDTAGNLIGARTSRSALQLASQHRPGRGGAAAVGGGPLLGRLEEGLGFVEAALVEVLALLRRLQRIPPRGERMQLHAGRRQHLDALREDAVVEDHEAVGDLCLGPLQRLDEHQLAAAVCGEVLDQEHALAGLEVALDLPHAAEPLGLLA